MTVESAPHMAVVGPTTGLARREPKSMTNVASNLADRHGTAPSGDSSSVLPPLSLRAMESASLIALVTAVLYFMGYSYYEGFFERISVPAPFPELSTNDYFVRAFSSLSGLVAAAGGSIGQRSLRSAAPNTIWQALWVNGPFIIVPLILGQHARSNGFLDQGLVLILGAIAGVGVVASLLKRSTLRLLRMQWGLASTLSYAFGILLFFGVYFRLEGSANATRFIEGRLEPSSRIVLKTRDTESPVNGVPLLVALARDGAFYLVQQASPAPVAPIVYFVPESEVLTATMQQLVP